MSKYCETKRYDCSDCTINKINEVLSKLENQRDRFNKLGLKGEVIGCVSAIEIIRNAFNQIVKEV